MKILQVVPYFYPAWAYGGPGKLVYDITKQMQNDGHHVTVYTSDCYDAEHRMPQSLKIERSTNFVIRYFSNISNYAAYHYNIYVQPFFFLFALYEIRYFDIVHLHDFYTPQHCFIIVLCRLFNVPCVLSVHGCLEQKRLRQKSLFKRIFMILCGNWMLKNTTVLVASSSSEVDSYRQFVGETKQIQLVTNGVDIHELLCPEDKTTCREHFSLPRDRFIVTFLGRIHKIKGVELICKAAALLNSDFMHFVVAGSDEGALESLKSDVQTASLTDKFSFFGPTFGTDKAQLFKASDVFIYPSFSEGFSIGILEAAASGLPLIITNGCNFPEVAEANAGIIVSNDAQEIAIAVHYYYKNADVCKEAGNNAKELVRSNYSITAMTRSLIATYASLI